MDCIQLSLPLKPTDLDEVYLDQAMVNGCGFFAAYTPYGIRMLDGRFADRIRAFRKGHPDPEDPLGLANDIINNPHLHAYIKENLLENLETYTGRTLKEIGIK